MPIVWLVLGVFVTLLALILSWSVVSDSTTSVLDFAGSLSQADDVISFDPQTVKPFEAETTQDKASSVSSLSLQLHPRASIYGSQHKDYRSLVLSRLGRDSARVNSLNPKLQFALEWVNQTGLEPMQTEIRPEDLSTPVTSGISLGSGEYFTRVGVESPRREKKKEGA